MRKTFGNIALLTCLAVILLAIRFFAQQQVHGLNFNPPVSATTGSIGGGALVLGTPATGTASVPGVAAGRPCIAVPSDGTSLTSVGSGLGITVGCAVTSLGTATVYVGVTVAGTPTAKTYTVVAFP